LLRHHAVRVIRVRLASRTGAARARARGVEEITASPRPSMPLPP